MRERETEGNEMHFTLPGSEIVPVTKAPSNLAQPVAVVSHVVFT